PLTTVTSAAASPPTGVYTLSLPDALPISPVEQAADGEHPPQRQRPAPAHEAGQRHRAQRGERAADVQRGGVQARHRGGAPPGHRSEEHTSELQSRFDLVCRLLLEKKKRPV